jgi:hypothetical protein
LTKNSDNFWLFNIVLDILLDNTKLGKKILIKCERTHTTTTLGRENSQSNPMQIAGKARGNKIGAVYERQPHRKRVSRTCVDVRWCSLVPDNPAINECLVE